MECKKVIPWQEMFRYAVQVCHVSPHHFWDMTIKEFIYLTNFMDNNLTISRADLEYMIRKFN